MTSQKITPCLWFDSEAEDGARLPEGAWASGACGRSGIIALSPTLCLSNRRAKMTTPAKPALEVGVECYAGHRGGETPLRFTLGRTIEVAEVLDAWLAPDHRYFKVRGDNILRNDVLIGRSELTMFDRSGAIGWSEA